MNLDCSSRYDTQGAGSQLTPINAKLRRLARGLPLRTIDLFAGCGGISLGFHLVGARIVAAVEIDPAAAASHQANFANEDYRLFGDIRALAPRELVRHLRESDPKLAADIIVGGPPCQPFSRIGRAKLRQIAQDPNAHLTDDRVTLYTHFLAAVEELQPLAFVMENVKDIGNFSRRNVAEEIALEAEGMGYVTRYALLNAAWYGVPQMRERMIIIGIHETLNTVPSFPAIKHRVELPQGYATSQMGTVSLRIVAHPYDHYVANLPQVENLLPAVTAEEAISDLPPITEHLDGRSGKGRRRNLDMAIEYANAPQNDYVRLMRSWPGFESRGRVTHHVIRYTPRDYAIFARMAPGDQYPEARRIAVDLFCEKVKRLDSEVGLKADDCSRLWTETVPPYDPKKYPNKWWKMDPNKPIRTIPAHVGKDTYSHIHYDSAQARTASVRELARLQSFPDGFTFVGSMNDCFRQIGNSVPPLMAYAIAETLVGQLRIAAASLTETGDH